ncbi:MAG: hypothetical protein RL112_2375 [Planctomycetota bacterium]|jgi:hypothetical protein
MARAKDRRGEAGRGASERGEPRRGAPFTHARLVHQALASSLLVLPALSTAAPLVGVLDAGKVQVASWSALVLLVVATVAAKELRAKGERLAKEGKREARADLEADIVPAVVRSHALKAALWLWVAGLHAGAALWLGAPLHLWIVVAWSMLQAWQAAPRRERLEELLRDA